MKWFADNLPGDEFAIEIIPVQVHKSINSLMVILANSAFDASGKNNHGTYETGYAFYLDGPDRDDLRTGGEKPRAVQFVGGRMKAEVDLPGDYEAEFFFWNGLPNDNRSVTGYLLSLGPDGAKNCPGDHLGIAGTAQPQKVGNSHKKHEETREDETATFKCARRASRAFLCLFVATAGMVLSV